MLVLLDQNAPQGLRAHLSGHEVVLARQRNWHELANGHLIAAAEASGFDVLITADQSIRYQQNLTGRRIAIIVLDTNHWDVVRAGIDKVREALGRSGRGAYIPVNFDRPPLRRRSFNPPPDF